MAFGGAVKLTGESEYRQALMRCTQDLQSMSNALKSQTADFNSNDKSMANSVSKQKELNDTIEKNQQAVNKAKSSLSVYSVEMQKQTTLHNSLNKEYKNAVLELDRIKKSSGETSTEYKKQAEVVDKLEKELIESQLKLDDNKSSMAALKNEIKSSQKTIDEASKGLDELGEEAEDSGKQVEKSTEGFTVLKGVLANLATKVITSAINGVKKLGKSFVDLTKASVESYASYEQLVGGVETLFKESSKVVLKYSQDAYKTAGLSANEYMETVTSFSASLLQGLKNNTKKAADYANMAIIDMSDNANKMGTSMEMIQNAYQGFAKQNYTMLDNLKLGFGGTKSEMARLVKESGILGKAGKDLTAKNLDQKVSFDQIVLAIHKVQEKMGIAGTTSKEAASTIEGSTNSMKASWKNLLVAIADDNQDLNQAIKNFSNSVITASKNLIPRVKKAIEGIKKMIGSIVTDVFPKLKKEIPQLKPLIETFEWFIDHKSLVVNSIKAMVTAFAVTKIAQFTKTISDGAKGFLEIVKNAALATTATTANTASIVANTGATVAGTTATNAMTVAQNLLNAAWKANPIGLVVAGVTTLITLYSIFGNKTDEATEKHKKMMNQLKEESDEIKRNKEAYEDLIQTQQSEVNANMTQIAKYESLYDELTQITDANGKVKKGYEDRASFIVSTLKDALGVEISMNGNVIKGYGDLQKSINEVIAQKKAKIILDSQEKLYQEALLKEQEAVIQLSKYATQIKENEIKISDLKMQKEGARTQYEAAQIQKRINNLEKENTEIQNNYNDQEEMLKQYAYNKGQYEKNMELFHKKQYDKMTNTSWDYVKSMQDIGESEKAQLEEQRRQTQIHYDMLLAEKQKSGTDIYNAQIKADQKLLNQYDEDLKKYRSALKENSNKCDVEWNNSLNSQITTIKNKNVTFKETGLGTMQMYVNGMKMGEPLSKNEASKVMTGIKSKFDEKQSSFVTSGRNVLSGINSGLNDSKSTNSLYSRMNVLGSGLLSRFNASLGIKSPSRKMMESAKFMLQGITKGIDKEEGNVLSTIDSFSADVVQAMNDGLSENITLENMRMKTTKNQMSNSSFIYDNLVTAFKDALMQTKIELDGEEMGKFVDKTVSDAIFS